jgi:hypothetical protein
MEEKMRNQQRTEWTSAAKKEKQDGNSKRTVA